MCTVVILDETKVNTGHLAYTNYGEVYSIITHTHTILDTLRRPMYLLRIRSAAENQRHPEHAV
jgi:hypothetical protein